MRTLKLVLPTYVILPRKTKADKKFILNLNNYRNAHFQILNQAKKIYKDAIEEIVKASEWDGVPFEKVHLEFTYYHKNRGRVDKSNPLSIIEKFACDALTELGMWDDDDSAHNPTSAYSFGGVDKENQRCEMIITMI